MNSKMDISYKLDDLDVLQLEDMDETAINDSDIDTLVRILAAEESGNVYLPYSPPFSNESSSPSVINHLSPPPSCVPPNLHYDVTSGHGTSQPITSPHQFPSSPESMASPHHHVTSQNPMTSPVQMTSHNSLSPRGGITPAILNPAFVNPSLPHTQIPTYKKRKHSNTSNDDVFNFNDVTCMSDVTNMREPLFGEIENLNLTPIDAHYTNIVVKQESEIPLSHPGDVTQGAALGRCNDVIRQTFSDDSLRLLWFSHYLEQECRVCDENWKEISRPTLHISADKGFTFSSTDHSFINHKKNHFQVSLSAHFDQRPVYATSPGARRKVDAFTLHVYGVKTHGADERVLVEQSKSDRKKRPFVPEIISLSEPGGYVAGPARLKTTISRLHFSETTLNNARQKGSPNKNQKYFRLVVGIFALCGDQEYPIAGAITEKFIVRASNPAQFESEPAPEWQAGTTPASLYHLGRVGVNTTSPEEALSVHGNIKVTGQIVQPSDIRLKNRIAEVNYGEQLKNVSELRLHRYQYNQAYARTVDMDNLDKVEIGVIAQEVKEYLPDAVQDVGNVTLDNGEIIENLLVVNKDRIFLESVGAVKELCKVTGNIEERVCELEQRDRKILRLTKKLRMSGYGSQSSGCSSKSSSSSKADEISSDHPGRHRRSIPSNVPCIDQGKCYPMKRMRHDICCRRVIFALLGLVFLLALISVASITAAVMYSERGNVDNKSGQMESDTDTEVIYDGLPVIEATSASERTDNDDGGVKPSEEVTSPKLYAFRVNCSMTVCRETGCCGKEEPSSVPLDDFIPNKLIATTTMATKHLRKSEVNQAQDDTNLPSQTDTTNSNDEKSKSDGQLMADAAAHVIITHKEYKYGRKRRSTQEFPNVDLGRDCVELSKGGVYTDYTCPATGLSDTSFVHITTWSSCKVVDVICSCQCTTQNPQLTTDREECGTSASVHITVTTDSSCQT